MRKAGRASEQIKAYQKESTAQEELVRATLIAPMLSVVRLECGAGRGQDMNSSEEHEDRPKPAFHLSAPRSCSESSVMGS